MFDRRFKIGIDIGGTFTDLTLLDVERGVLHHYKVPSTQHSPSDALISGVQQLTEQVGITPEAIAYFVHGTTLALNTVIQRRGARTALIVSRGNRSVLDLARLRVPQQFSFAPAVPEPLVPSSRVREIGGRILASGEEIEPLSPDEVAAAVAWLKEQEVEACAISLLHAYANPSHEQAVKRAIEQALPTLIVAASSGIWPEIREYERTMVAVLNAYIAPQMARYLARLERDAAAIGLRTELYITKSNGGIMSAASARQAPVETLLSGPASGVVGAAFAAKLAGIRHCVTLDMGGTSADVSLILDGEPVRSTENHAGDYPVVMPSVDVSSIGAGGGSIAWVDPYGVLKVGPESAGAEPGPACYGLGGTAATVTDAYVVCGFLNPGHFLGGRMRLDPQRASEAIAPIARRLGQSVPEAAESILQVATANMVTEFFPLMTKKGVDPREYALLPYGGAGPTHACLLAAEVGIGRIVVPHSPGTLCATGALINDVKKDYVQTFRCALDGLDLNEVRKRFGRMEEEARRWLDGEGIDLDRREFLCAADMRYKGQAYEIEVPIDAVALESVETLRRRFHDRHETVYRHADRGAAVELVNLRVRVVGITPPVTVRLQDRAEGHGRAEPKGRRTLLLRGQRLSATIYERAALRPGHRLPSPCIVEQDDTTTVILPGFAGRVDAYGNLVLERE
ncbi:MAG: hydantoinase/oxoprolinase family protein [Deltaproteobacteria bacterium]|nr:hydantoinase/oxoprolinase family protein [Deltaproteobacteria bacterium]